MDDVRLTASEWNILNCLWEHSPQTVMQLVGELEKTVGWARSFLDRVYQGSVGMMMSAMARQEGLSREQIAQLRAILDQAEQEAEG